MTAPKFENAPGLVVRPRKDGTYSAFWLCRTDLAKAGFKPRVVPLWRGMDPSDPDRAYVSDQCRAAQAEMLVWGRGGVPELVSFDGTVASLIASYRSDKDSPYAANRYATRKHYDSLCRRIATDLGHLRIEEIDARQMKHTHEAWATSGIPMAHSLIGMMRGLLKYGGTMLKSAACKALKADLSEMRFEMGKPRVDRLTAEMAIAIRAKAHEMGFPSIALAQAIQFEGTFRQKDIIGEMVPASEPGIGITYGDEKWLWGIRWNEIDANLKLTHITSKRKKKTVVDLKYAPMVLEEIAKNPKLSPLPTVGPVIICERTGQPWRAHYFREKWREIARAAGVPDHIRNQDTRSGAITEAIESGASLEDARKAATHSTSMMTAKYSRGDEEAVAATMQKRASHREQKQNNGDQNG